MDNDTETEEEINLMYCKECGRQYKVKGSLGLQPESIIGILLTFIIGFGFLSWKRVTCPYCDGRLKKVKDNPKL
jgi:uncharacterized protein YbaR (Trm112 family)